VLELTLIVFNDPGNHLDLQSFPTRRSSDLGLHVEQRRERAHRRRSPEGTAREHAQDHSVDLEPRKRFARIVREIGLDLFVLLRRSEEHTSELQSPCNLVCRLLLDKKKKHYL